MLGEKLLMDAQFVGCPSKIGTEESCDASRISNADLNMVQRAQTSSGIHWLAFVEESTDAVKWRLTCILTKFVKVIHYGTIQKAGF
jgi:hypothetical protein